MAASRVALLCLLYLLLDFANPHMPGALTFDPDESIEGVHAERGRQTSPVHPSAPPPQAPRLILAPDLRPTKGRLRASRTPRWRAALVRRTLPAVPRSLSSDDH